LWPLQVFEWNENRDNKELDYYYPTNTLVTGPDIIFFWVARMVMAGYEFKGKKPFDQVYFTGIIRDKQGRKMSKQLGNSPDLLELIENYGADTVRFSVMISSPAGNDILYDEAFLEQGRNFCNKMWNAMKLVKMWEGRVSTEVSTEDTFAIDWMQERIKQVELSIEELLKDFRLSEALKNIYSLIWDDFCSWYLEWVKPGFEQPMSAMVYNKTIDIYESLLQLLHPFMPFVTEEIYHLLRQQSDDLMSRQLTAFGTPNSELLSQGTKLQELITAIRDARVKNNLKPKDVIKLSVDTKETSFYTSTKNILGRQINAEEISFTNEAVQRSISLVLGIDKLYISSNVAIDTAAQKEQLQKDLDYQKGFLMSVEKKLSNEKFVANAKPEVIESERKKQSDALAKIKTIEESLSLL
jgi:valyl-tRNA synthetase